MCVFVCEGAGSLPAFCLVFPCRGTSVSEEVVIDIWGGTILCHVAQSFIP